MTTAQAEILSMYDKEQLHDIAEHGCASGCASQHIYYSDTLSFFDKHEEEIQDDLQSRYGDDFLVLFAKDIQDVSIMKNNMVWAYIEGVANDACSVDEVYA